MRMSLLLVLPSVAAGPSSADTIDVPGGTQFSIFDSGGTPIPGNAMTIAGTFAPFDPSLGELESVDWGISGMVAGFLTLSDLAPGEYVFGVFVDLEMSAPDGTTIYRDTFGIGANSRTVLADGSVVPASDATGTPFEARFVDGNTIGGGLPARTITEGLAHFVGPDPLGEFEVQLRLSFRFNVGGPLDGAVFAADAVGGIFAVGGSGQIVRYTYTPVPEPGTALLVGMGLVVMAVWRARGSSSRCAA